MTEAHTTVSAALGRSSTLKVAPIVVDDTGAVLLSRRMRGDGWELPLIDVTDTADLSEALRHGLDRDFGVKAAVVREIGRERLWTGEPAVVYACRSAGQASDHEVNGCEWITYKAALSGMKWESERSFLQQALDASL